MNWRKYALLFGLNMLATSEFWKILGAMTDEGLGVVGAQRILTGEWPYRDWNSDITPGIYLLGALWFGLFGVSNLSIRLLLSLISATTSVILQASAEKVLPGPWRYLPWLIWTTSGLMEFPVLNHHWLGICFVMLGWYCMLNWCTRNRRQDRWSVGACAALALWSIQSEGLALTLAVVFLWLRFRPAHGLEVLLAAVVSSLVLWLPCLGNVPQILQQNVLEVRHHVAWNRNPYSWSCLYDFLRHYQGLSWNDGPFVLMAIGSHVAFNVVRYLSLPVITLALLWGAERRGRPLEKVLAYAWLASLVANHSRATIVYVSFQGPGWALVFSLVLSWIARGKWLAVALAALEGLGWMARGWLRHQVYIHPFPTPIGVFYSVQEGQTVLAYILADWRRRYLPPGTPVVVFPTAAHFYSCFGWKPACRRILMPPNEISEEEYREIHQDILKRRVPWLIYMDVDINEVVGNYRVDPKRLRRQWDELRAQMTEGYELVEGDSQLALFRLKVAEP